MKYLIPNILVLCLLAGLALAQDGGQSVRWTSIMLANNRQAMGIPFFMGGRRGMVVDKPETTETSVQQYRSQVFTCLTQKNYEEATVWMEKMTGSYPKEHGFIGENYLSRLHDYPRALSHLQAYDALTANFDDMIGNNPVSYLLGLAYRGLGNHSKALYHFSVGIDSLATKHGAEWVNYRHFVSRAVSYIATNQADKALSDLDKAAKNYPKSALVAYHKGIAYLQLNRLTEARTAFQDASFFYKALRAERTGDYQEDDTNPIYEEEIDEALSKLKQLKS